MQKSSKGAKLTTFTLATFLMTTVLSGFAAAQSTPPPIGSGTRHWPSQSYTKQSINVRVCSCRYAGQNIPIGKTICMTFQGKRVLAKCDTVVNNPSWSISSVVCPSS